MRLIAFRPVLDPDEEAAILALLLPVLSPVGDHRRRHAKNKEKKKRPTSTVPEILSEHSGHSSSVPAQIQDYLTVGFNSTTRKLQSLSAARTPTGLYKAPSNGETVRSAGQVAAVFVCRDSLPEIMTSSLPILISTAAPRETRARLIEISPQAEAKVAHALGLPRVGMLGLEPGAPGTEALLGLVLEKTQVVDVPWLDLTSLPSYVAVQVERMESTTDCKRSIARN